MPGSLSWMVSLMVSAFIGAAFAIVVFIFQERWRSIRLQRAEEISFINQLISVLRESRKGIERCEHYMRLAMGNQISGGDLYFPTLEKVYMESHQKAVDRELFSSLFAIASAFFFVNSNRSRAYSSAGQQANNFFGSSIAYAREYLPAMYASWNTILRIAREKASESKVSFPEDLNAFTEEEINNKRRELNLPT